MIIYKHSGQYYTNHLKLALEQGYEIILDDPEKTVLELKDVPQNREENKGVDESQTETH